MEKFQAFLNDFINSGNLNRYVILGVILVLGSLAIGAAGRFVFGKRSLLGTALSSAIAIVFLYALTATFLALGSEFSRFTAPLPFVTTEGDSMIFFTFSGNDHTAICTQLLNMVILAFVVCIADRFLPRGKNIFIWIIFRVITVAFGFVAHFLISYLLANVVPEGIAQYAPTVMLIVLGALLLTGALKFLVGFVLGAVNPFIGALYTFFFANIIGKQLTRSVLTTAIIALLIFALESIGISAISISAESLMLYIPYGAGLLGLWYLSNRLF